MRYKAFLLMALCAAASSAQVGSGAMRMTSAGNIIDGRVHPEQIKDVVAYRLVLVTIAEQLNAPAGQGGAQSDPLQPIGLEQSDKDSTVKIISVFRAKYGSAQESVRLRILCGSPKSDKFGLGSGQSLRFQEQVIQVPVTAPAP